MRVRTCEAGDVFDVFTRVEDTREVFVGDGTCVCVRYSGVPHVCMYTMLDSTTCAFIVRICGITTILRKFT